MQWLRPYLVTMRFRRLLKSSRCSKARTAANHIPRRDMPCPNHTVLTPSPNAITSTIDHDPTNKNYIDKADPANCPVLIFSNVVCLTTWITFNASFEFEVENGKLLKPLVSRSLLQYLLNHDLEVRPALPTHLHQRQICQACACKIDAKSHTTERSTASSGSR